LLLDGSESHGRRSRHHDRVAEKASFTREGVLRSARWNARLGRRVDWVMYTLLPADLA